MKKKPFIITIDTEGDNLWQGANNSQVTTKNVNFLYRFQDMANEYGLKPTWLSDWEIICDESFISFAKEYRDNCEIGMHLHAWNNPPLFELPQDNIGCKPYLIEYPKEIMSQKIRMITETFEKNLGFKPVSHRAGRWAINDSYFELLAQYGYKYDCSITPGVNWSKSKGQTKSFLGPDYRKEKNEISNRKGIIEIPLNTTMMHYLDVDKGADWYMGLKRIVKGMVGQHIYLRPGVFRIEELLRMIDAGRKNDDKYLMFMMHSSELMPGGSPYFATQESIEKLYKDVKILFNAIKIDFVGMTLRDFGESIKEGFY